MPRALLRSLQEVRLAQARVGEAGEALRAVAHPLIEVVPDRSDQAVAVAVHPIGFGRDTGGHVLDLAAAGSNGVSGGRFINLMTYKQGNPER